MLKSMYSVKIKIIPVLSKVIHIFYYKGNSMLLVTLNWNKWKIKAFDGKSVNGSCYLWNLNLQYCVCSLYEGCCEILFNVASEPSLLKKFNTISTEHFLAGLIRLRIKENLIKLILAINQYVN